MRWIIINQYVHVMSNEYETATKSLTKSSSLKKTLTQQRNKAAHILN